MRKPSPAVHIPGLSKTGIAAAQAVPTAFVDIETSAIDTRGGLVAPGSVFNATVPNWQLYDTGRFIFGPLTVTGVLEDLEVELWGIDAQGIAMLIGRSVVTAANTLPPITGVPIAGRVQYAIRVAVVAYTTTGTLAFPVFAQGYYKDADDA
jgi:hypothetical protein